MLDLYYDFLQSEPAVAMKGHKATEKTISIPAIQKIHVLLRKAFAQAVQWDYIPKNPATDVSLPKQKKKRAAWTFTAVITALTCCENPYLKLAMLLAIMGSMRIGEILGLKWENMVFYIEGTSPSGPLWEQGGAPSTKGAIHVTMELKRCQKSAIEALQKKSATPSTLFFLLTPKVKQVAPQCLPLRPQKMKAVCGHSILKQRWPMH